MYHPATLAQNRTWRKWKAIENSIRSSDLYNTMELRAYKCKNDGYGELLVPFTLQLANALEIKENTRLLDVGSGIGFVGIDLAALTLCSVRGIEVRRDLWATSKQVLDRVSRLNLNASFHLGDATSNEFTFREADIVLCCNTLWSSENNYKLLHKLCLELPVGAKVVVLEKLGGHRDRAGSKRSSSNMLGAGFEMPPHEFISPPNAVSWTNKPVNFYIYTKKKMPKSMAQELIKERKLMEVFEMQRKKNRAMGLLKEAQQRRASKSATSSEVKRSSSSNTKPVASSNVKSPVPVNEKPPVTTSVKPSAPSVKPSTPASGKHSGSLKVAPTTITVRRIRDTSTGRYVRTKVVAIPPKRGRGRPRKNVAVLQTTSPDRPTDTSRANKRGLIVVSANTQPPIIDLDEPPAKRIKKDTPAKSPKYATIERIAKTPPPKPTSVKSPTPRSTLHKSTPGKLLKASPPKYEAPSPPPYEPPTTRSKISTLASSISNTVSQAMQRISGRGMGIVKSRGEKEEEEEEEEEEVQDGTDTDTDNLRGLRRRRFNSFLNDYIA